MNSKLIAGGVVLALVLSLVAVFKAGPGPAGRDGKDGLGAIPGVEVSGPSWSVNGVRSEYASSRLRQATTTVCALRSPSATSTLMHASITLDTSSTTATTVTLAKATTAYATTTLVTSAAVNANAQATIIATSTANTVSALGTINTRVFAPNNYLVVGMQGGVGSFSPVGSCNAEWRVDDY